jgi:hypothetical protein
LEHDKIEQEEHGELSSCNIHIEGVAELIQIKSAAVRGENRLSSETWNWHRATVVNGKHRFLFYI